MLVLVLQLARIDLATWPPGGSRPELPSTYSIVFHIGIEGGNRTMVMENIKQTFKAYTDPKALLEEKELETNDIVDILKADHARVNAMFVAYETVEEDELKRALVANVIKSLSVHATLEEELVYPMLQSLMEEETLEAHEEHHLVKIAMAELADVCPCSKEAKAKMTVLSEMVRHHVKEEEGELLPRLKTTGVNLEELGSRFKRRRAEIMSHIQKIGELSDETGGGVDRPAAPRFPENT